MASTTASLTTNEQGVAILAGGIFGALIHYTVFRHGEWHIQAPEVIVAHGVIAALLTFRGSFKADPALSLLLDAVSLAYYYGYFVGITTSIIVYRVFFHRLAKAGYPGPWYAKISKIWHVYAARYGKNHEVLDALHHKYGDIVRTGPAEVTVFTPDAFQILDGPRTTCTKAEFYDMLKGLGYQSLVNIRQASEQKIERRREWQHGFLKTSIEHYQKRVSPHIDQVVNLLAEDARNGRESQMSDYVYWFSFDAMGEFVFSKSFGMLENQEPSPVIRRLQSALFLLAPLGPAPWLLQAGLRLGPKVWAIKDFYDTLDWCGGQMVKRLERMAMPKDSEEKKNPQNDLAYHLMESKRGSSGKERTWNMAWLTGDSLLAIVAGSDPTGGTFMGIFAELAKHPEHIDKIYEEVEDLDVNDFKAIAALPHLNAVLKEIMRLYPSLLTGGIRKTQDQPVVIGGHVIPPYTTVVAPRYTINRRPDCFVRPNEFIPERWTTNPELILDKSGFTPWGVGHRACLGRGLAEELMRGLMARIIKNLNFRLAPGETGDRVGDDMRDQFVPKTGPLSLCFEKRQ